MKRILPILFLTICSSVNAANMEFVFVRNAGNIQFDPLHIGNVDHDYRIAKYEVSNVQYAEFLNAVAGAQDTNGLYNFSMATDPTGGITRQGSPGNYNYAVKQNFSNKPVNFVSWFDAARMANWLHNGKPVGPQGLGTTEIGAYDLTGETPATHTSVARYWLPTQDEWFKSAFFSPVKNGGTPGYWTYPTQADESPDPALANPDGTVSNPGANVANYASLFHWNNSDTGGNVSTVGGTGAPSYYGTFDQGGNVWEWRETLATPGGGSARFSWGGAFNNGSLQLSTSGGADPFSQPGPSHEVLSRGFRLASIVPEPSSILLLTSAGAVVAGLRSRKKAIMQSDARVPQGGTDSVRLAMDYTSNEAFQATRP